MWRLDIIILQFSCEGSWLLLCQQQRYSAPCFRGACPYSMLNAAFFLPPISRLQLGALHRLNRMIASPMLHLKQHSALSLSFLCSTNSTAQLSAVDAGALSVVQDLFRSNRTDAVVTGLRFIFNLACVAPLSLLLTNNCPLHRRTSAHVQIRQHHKSGRVPKARCNGRNRINIAERQVEAWQCPQAVGRHIWLQ